MGMSRPKMLATFFVHDMSKNQSWRLKGHAERKFFEWLATMSMDMKHPVNLGYVQGGYDLPLLNIEHIILESAPDEGSLFATVAQTLTERRDARKLSLEERVKKATEIVTSKDCCLVW